MHPHPESYPQVTAKVIYTVVGPRGTRQDQDQGTVALPAELSLHAQGPADAARQGTRGTSGGSKPRVKIFSREFWEFCQLQTASSAG